MTDYTAALDGFTPRTEESAPGRRTIEELLISQNQLLEELLAELKRANSVERTGAVSSVEVKWTAATKDLPSKPAPVVKVYAGSEAPVDEAIVAYARTMVAAQHAQMAGWEQTVVALENGNGA